MNLKFKEPQMLAVILTGLMLVPKHFLGLESPTMQLCACPVGAAADLVGASAWSACCLHA